MKKKTIALVLACILCVGAGIGGTLAWLTATSGEVTNTFTAAKLGTVSISETDTDHNYLLTPGVDITKDPKLSFTRTDDKGVAAFVFVKVTAANWTVDETTHKVYTISDENRKEQLKWEIASDWTYLTTDNGSYVYYREVAENGKIEDASIMKDNKITVSGDYITTANIDALAGKMGITFTPYAIQKQQSSTADFTAADAWAKLA